MARDHGAKESVPPSVRASTKGPAVPAADVPDHPVLRLQSQAGNRATVATVRDAQFALEVGAADDAYEREADSVARRVVAALAAPTDTPPAVGTVDRLLQRRAEPSAPPIGAEGGEVDRDSEAQLRAARSGGAKIPTGDRERLERAFGGADFGEVRLHEGRQAADLNARFGARAFTVGSDIFFRGATPDLASRSGSELLAHELAHTIQQSPTQARRLLIRRDFVDSWDLTYPKLSPKGQLGYNQFVTLNGSASAEKVREGAREKGGDNAGKFNTERADSIWSKKAMETDAFDKALAKKQAQDTDDVKGLLATMNHLCNETDGTHRPGSEGDGTSEWALKWEAANGEPFRSPAGHALKLRDYCKVLSEGLASVAAKKGSVKPTEKMQWTEKNNAAPVEVEVQAQLATVVVRATDRLAKMRVGVSIWNNRIATYPDKWNADGTSKLAPPGVDPLAKKQLQAGWPKDKTVKEY